MHDAVSQNMIRTARHIISTTYAEMPYPDPELHNGQNLSACWSPCSSGSMGGRLFSKFAPACGSEGAVKGFGWVGATETRLGLADERLGVRDPRLLIDLERHPGSRPSRELERVQRTDADVGRESKGRQDLLRHLTAVRSGT